MTNVSSLQEKRAKKREAKEFAGMAKAVAMKMDAVSKISVISPKTMHHTVDLRRVVAWAHVMQIDYGVHRMRLEFCIYDKEPEPRNAGLLVTMLDGVYIMSLDGIMRLDQFPHRVVEITVGAQIGRWEAV